MSLLVGAVVDTTDPAHITDPARLTEYVVAAERAGLSFVLFDDGPGAPGVTGWSLDPIELAAFASASTRSIGLLATAAATHAEPYHLSNRFSSLDWGSGGRAGWLVTVDRSDARAHAYAATVPGPADAVREADAVVDAARRLWDSWEDGALIADTAGGRFLDADKLHYVDAGEPLFSITGPALMPRPVQGQVVVLGRAGDGLADLDVVIGDGPGTRVFAEITADRDPVPVLRNLRGDVDGVVVSGLDAAEFDALAPLVADGTLVPPRPGRTLRRQLGLPRPPSRYATPAGAPV